MFSILFMAKKNIFFNIINITIHVRESNIKVNVWEQSLKVHYSTTFIHSLIQWNNMDVGFCLHFKYMGGKRGVNLALVTTSFHSTCFCVKFYNKFVTKVTCVVVVFILLIIEVISCFYNVFVEYLFLWKLKGFYLFLKHKKKLSL